MIRASPSKTIFFRLRIHFSQVTDYATLLKLFRFCDVFLIEKSSENVRLNCLSHVTFKNMGKEMIKRSRKLSEKINSKTNQVDVCFSQLLNKGKRSMGMHVRFFLTVRLWLVKREIPVHKEKICGSILSGSVGEETVNTFQTFFLNFRRRARQFVTSTWETKFWWRIRIENFGVSIMFRSKVLLIEVCQMQRAMFIDLGGVLKEKT